MNKDIVFFGIQGSWKWTQAKIFLEEYPNFKYIEPGQIFRALSSNANAISGFMKDTMAQWKMLPDTLAFDLFTMCFHLLESNELMLTDGFPRTMAQLHYFIAKECENILSSKESNQLDILFKMGGSSGGTRPKILISENNRDWIIKFPSKSDPEISGKREFDYSLCAKGCGISMTETELIPSTVCEGYFKTWGIS